MQNHELYLTATDGNPWESPVGTFRSQHGKAKQGYEHHEEQTKHHQIALGVPKYSFPCPQGRVAGHGRAARRKVPLPN